MNKIFYFSFVLRCLDHISLNIRKYNLTFIEKYEFYEFHYANMREGLVNNRVASETICEKKMKINNF